jgi:hypothetical protein
VQAHCDEWRRINGRIPDGTVGESKTIQESQKCSSVAQQFAQHLITGKLAVRELVSSPSHSPRHVVSGADADLVYPELFAASPYHTISVEAAEKVIGGEPEQFRCFSYWHSGHRELIDLPLAC